MKYRKLEFTPDELATFKIALDGTPTERLLRDVIQVIRNEAKIELQVPTRSLEEMRVQQGIIAGMIKLKEIIADLLSLDIEALMDKEVENAETEVEDEDVGNFDF